GGARVGPTDAYGRPLVAFLARVEDTVAADAGDRHAVAAIARTDHLVAVGVGSVEADVLLARRTDRRSGAVALAGTLHGARDFAGRDPALDTHPLRARCEAAYRAPEDRFYCQHTRGVERRAGDLRLDTGTIRLPAGGRIRVVEIGTRAVGSDAGAHRGNVR